LQHHQACDILSNVNTAAIDEMPKTRDGLARTRAATTRHGRYAAESRALHRLIRQYQRNGVESARNLMGREAAQDAAAPARLAELAGEPPPPALVEAMRETVKADVARTEQQRLARWAHMNRSRLGTGSRVARVPRGRWRERRHPEPHTP
jgi:hypothetical protein